MDKYINRDIIMGLSQGHSTAEPIINQKHPTFSNIVIKDKNGKKRHLTLVELESSYFEYDYIKNKWWYKLFNYLGL